MVADSPLMNVLTDSTNVRHTTPGAMATKIEVRASLQCS